MMELKWRHFEDSSTWSFKYKAISQWHCLSRKKKKHKRLFDSCAVFCIFWSL